VKFFLADEVRLEEGRALRQFELQLAQSRAHGVPDLRIAERTMANKNKQSNIRQNE